MSDRPVETPEPPPPPELPRSTEAARGRAGSEDSAHDDASATSRAVEHEEARSAARQEFAEASRGQGEPERVDIPRQREPDVLTPSDEPAERLEAQPTSDVHELPDRLEQPGEDRANADKSAQTSDAGEVEAKDALDLVSQPDPIVAEPLDDESRDAFAAYRQQLVDEGKDEPADKAGPEYDYQRKWCGDTEFRISPDADLPRATKPDGLNDDLGLAQDAKYVHPDSRSSWFIPETLSPNLVGQSERKMDLRLMKYRDAIESSDNPIRGLEIFTNRPEAAEFILGRMNALNIPGIVRVRP